VKFTARAGEVRSKNCRKSCLRAGILALELSASSATPSALSSTARKARRPRRRSSAGNAARRAERSENSANSLVRIDGICLRVEAVPPQPDLT
jgi:hypothetical protein